jgi:hypothetical protein
MKVSAAPKATCTRARKKVCEWSDDSWGGSMRVHFVSKAEEAAFVPFARPYYAAIGAQLKAKYNNIVRIVNEAISSTPALR